MKKIRVLLILICIFLVCGCGNKEEEVVEEHIPVPTCEKGEMTPAGNCKIVTSMDPKVTCPSGFDYNKESHKCEYIISIPAQGEYYCADGYTLTSGKCINKETKDVQYRKKRWICPAGGKVNGKNCDIADQKDVLKFECTDSTYTFNQETYMCEIISYEDAVLK